MYFSREVYKKIQSTIGNLEPECGGIIAMNQDGIISDYYFDADAGFGKASYIPSRISLQDYIRDNWSSPKLRFCGVVHSHPLCNTCEPSYIDIKMALKIMTINSISEFHLLMVKGHEVKMYCITNENNQYSCEEEKIEIRDLNNVEL